VLSAPVVVDKARKKVQRFIPVEKTNQELISHRSPESLSPCYPLEMETSQSAQSCDGPLVGKAHAELACSAFY